ncbi:MAG: acetylxylan esterase [Bacilli bacterium]|nr:acetylxylan esterase [Bacilli bacterium]
MEERFKCSVLTKKPKDFDERWAKWLKEVHDVKNNIEIVDEDVRLDGFGKIISFYYDSVQNGKIYAKLYLRWEPNRPVVAYYHGHMSFIEDKDNDWHCMNLVAGGFNVVAIDMRFQNGKAIDNNKYRYMEYPSACFNIDDLETCYNKILDQDALKVLDIIKDPNIFKDINGTPLSEMPLMVAGHSQGGGLSLMVSAMSDYDITCSLSDVPSDCAIKDRIINREGKYTVIDDFLKDHPELTDVVMKNQDYFDVINMADKIKCPVFSSVGAIDDTCPPKYYYQAYKKMKCEKYLDVYEGFGHGGFEEIHLPKKIAFAKKLLKCDY